MKLFMLTGAIVFIFCSSNSANAQTTGDFRTINSGNWKTAASWQRYNGTAWVAAVSPPTFNNGKIAIRQGHTITVADSVYADQITVNSGGVLDIVSGRLFLMNGPGTDLVCSGRLKVANNAVLERDSSQSAATSSVDYKNDTLFESGGISPDVSFDGTTAQVIVGSGYMGTAIVNNLLGLQITGTVSFNLVKFIVGKINVTGTGLLVTSQYSNGFIGQDNHNYIEGKVVCIVYDSSLHTFNLPIGKGQYMPAVLKLRQDSLVQTGFGITITSGTPPAHTLPATLDRVSSVRFYTIDKSSSVAHIKTGSLQLSYLADDKVSDIAKLRIAKSEGAAWKNLGGIGSGLPSGVITTTVNFTTPGDFVLANATGGGNTLPINIASFNAIAHRNFVLLNWKVLEEANIRLYQLQRKAINNGDWENIASVTVNNTGSYNYTDEANKKAGKLLYRLLQINKDGKKFYSKEVAVMLSAPLNGITIVELYPNPVEQVLHVMIEDKTSAMVDVNISNMVGRVLISRVCMTNEPLNIPVEMLKNGQYVITAYNSKTSEKAVMKFVKK